MTREQTIEAIRVMQAFADGKEVEFKWTSKDWNSTDKPEWNWSGYDYGVEPSATLRPWTSDEVPLEALERIKRLEDAGDNLLTVMRGEEAAAYCEWIALAHDAELNWRKDKEAKL